MSFAQPTVLVIDQKPELQEQLQQASAAGRVGFLGASTAATGLSILRQARPDVLLIGSELSDCGGVDLVRRARSMFDGPIIVVSADAREVIKIEILDAGANDYMVSPPASGEMLARIRATLRRHQQNEQLRPAVEVAGLSVDLASRTATLDGRALTLCNTELKVLLALAEFNGATAPHEFIISSIWDPECKHAMQYLRVAVFALRKKLSKGSIVHNYIETAARIGYRLNLRHAQS